MQVVRHDQAKEGLMMGMTFRSLSLVLAVAGAACAQLGDEPEEVTEEEQASSPTWTWGFAWVNPGAPLSPLYSYNSSGGTNTYSGTNGSYAVFMPGLDQGGGNVQVVGYGLSPVRCKVLSWGASASGTLVQVRCHNPSGVLAASPFVVFYDKSVSGVGATYLWYDGASVPATFSANATGGSNSVAHPELGRYRVSLGGIASSNASVHVTAYGSGPEHCSIESYWPGATVNVRCFNASGGAADSAFSLHYTNSAPRPGLIGGHAYIATATSAPATLQQNQHWLQCFSTPPITVTGFQSVYYPDTALSTSAPTMSLSTAYGTAGTYCKVASWVTQSTGFAVQTQCFSPTGTPVTSRFVSSFMLASAPGPC